MDTVSLAERVLSYFRRVHELAFADDPTTNQNLSVEVVGTDMARDSCVMVLVTPWTLAGLVFPPEDWRPTYLEVGNRRFTARPEHVDGIGHYLWIPLSREVASYRTQESIRTDAEEFAAMLRLAVDRARRRQGGHVEPDRRSRDQVAASGL